MMASTQDQDFLLSKIQSKLSRASGQFWLLAIFLTIVFATGGSARNDVQSLIILNPVSLLVCALAVASIRRSHLRENVVLLTAFGAAVILSMSHIAPLPPALWQSRSGLDEVAMVQQLIGGKLEWKSWTPSFSSGLQATLALAAPLAVLLLGVQLGADDKSRLLPLLIALATFSGFVGLLQAISDPNGPLYFYRTTNNGSAVGLFANRNHAATLLACLFPMLAVYASLSTRSADEKRRRIIWVVAIGVVLVPLILITGSRSGFFVALLGLGGAALLHSREGQKKSVGSKNFAGGPLILGGLGVLALGLLTLIYSRAEALERFWSEDPSDSRTEFAIISIDMVRTYFPWGSGSGSFVEAYQLAEPGRMLDATYLNRAHNDWLETAVTLGLPGIIFLAVVTCGYVWHSSILWRHRNTSRRLIILGRLGSVAIGMVALASLSDYPVRTPIMMSVMVVFTLWFLGGRRTERTATSLTA
jgi:O-Antigen ligase